MRGKDVCYHHGAKSLSGEESPSFKHGRYQNALPARMVERYQEHLKDPAATVLKDEVALTRAMQEDLLGRLDSGESGAAWLELKNAWRQFQEAQPMKDATAAGRALRRMGELIAGGADEAEARKEIRATTTQIRQLAESERRRAVENQEVLYLEQALAYRAAMTAAVKDVAKEVLKDAKLSAVLLGALGARFDVITNAHVGGDGGGLSPN